MNTQLVEQLIMVLDRENSIYEDLLKISKNKTNSIVEGKVAELDSIVKMEQTLILQIGKLESLREDLTEKISKEVELDTTKLTILELVKRVETNLGEKLKRYQSKLNTTLKDIKDANELNSKLIKNSLEYINFSLNLISDTGVANNNYGNKGIESGNKKRNFFDVKL